ncbi:hypothetical protein NDU88_001082 [Pleurodeles waltl]|uniref:Uncharacterized protein n=1 Tax=Pleurodeles waltl TaxID=8319 RepID=A0AAV7LXN8_PLEWA|nr:hypothetical protein NDU88_001082 [Pleurodeles waltl]
MRPSCQSSRRVTPPANTAWTAGPHAAVPSFSGEERRSNQGRSITAQVGVLVGAGLYPVTNRRILWEVLSQSFAWPRPLPVSRYRAGVRSACPRLQARS